MGSRRAQVPHLKLSKEAEKSFIPYRQSTFWVRTHEVERVHKGFKALVAYTDFTAYLATVLADTPSNLLTA